MFWKWSDRNEEQQEGEENTRQAPVARLYTVFNVYQCELPERLASLLTIDTPTAEPPALLENCERIITDMPQRPDIQHGEARAYYRPSTDTVNMPERSLFAKAEHYYSVLFHELAHSSGHASRLDRATLNQRMAFGDTNYSKEELCAEMGAAYLCGVAGIVNETVNNSAAYIQGWLGKLRNDKKLLIQAAASAQKASDFILGESKA